MLRFSTIADRFTVVTITLMITASMARSQRIAGASTVPTPDVGVAIMMPVHCDQSGNMFLRTIQPPIIEGSLLKLSPDGKRVATFDVSAAAKDNLKDLVVKTFAIGPGGFVYQLAKTKDQKVVVVKFDGDGRYSESLILDRQFEPQQLGVFKGEDLLVSGVTIASSGSKPDFAPYTAMFDRYGRWIKQIDTNEPRYSPARGRLDGSAGQINTDNPVAPPELGIVESDDLYVYLLRQGTTPTVYVISPAGVVERKLTLSPPPYLDTQIAAVRVGMGQMMIEYVRPKAFPNGNAAYYLRLYELQQGEKLLEYTRDSDVSGTLGCTDWRGNLSFLSADAKGRVLLKATMR
jgi:hypothetical protein